MCYSYLIIPFQKKKKESMVKDNLIEDEGKKRVSEME